jgi:hypothetical protein
LAASPLQSFGKRCHRVIALQYLADILLW